MRFVVFLCVWLCAFGALAAPQAAPQFPERGTQAVVDDAHILSPQAVELLEQNLTVFEQQTGDQFVVATVSSLQGNDIAEYGYQLGRAWQLGQKGKNNGVLLIVAPNEHKVRIEVGYGLEGDLTDAQSTHIIQGVILPEFKAGNMEQGVLLGAQEIVTTLGGQAFTMSQGQSLQPVYADSGQEKSLGILPIIILLLLFFFLMRRGGSGGGFFSGMLLSSLLSSGSSRSGWGGGSSGFGGGGGSFGGGGSSGSW